MKVLILAGGLGTRLSQHTKSIPKPMVRVGGLPILIHIMKHYLKYGFNEFYIAAGYKSHVIKKYFKNYKKNGKQFNYKISKKKCIVTVADTGKKTLTGGRLKRLKKYLKKDETFMFTYGDGVSNVNLKDLLKFHLKRKKLITVTTVRPPARFGEIVIKNNFVKHFKEKPQVTQGWINGGFFVTNTKIFDIIRDDKEVLEKKPLETASKKNQFIDYKHYGFWKCMDTPRDKDVLNKILKKKKQK
jgi:glucose-1-phosphate cytidylyltransferase